MTTLRIDADLIEAEATCTAATGGQPGKYTRADSMRAFAQTLRLTLTRTSRANGKVLGPITYTFTSEAQRDAFVAGRWP